MTKPAYYNEYDTYVAQWLRNLIRAGHIAPGDVDERSIEDVRPDDLRGYTQCHFFAGVGVWSYALRRAGWADDRPVWTGSCPCQPFSSAGAGAGFADERHLWPAWLHLISEHIRRCRKEKRRPPVLFGEQVASKDADPWIDLVQDDMEALGYGFGAIAFPSAGVGAPHIRDRTYWVADPDGNGFQPGEQRLEAMGHRPAIKSDRSTGGLGNSDSSRSQGFAGNDSTAGRKESGGSIAEASIPRQLDDTISLGFDTRWFDNRKHDGIIPGTAGEVLRLGHAKHDGCNAGPISGSDRSPVLNYSPRPDLSEQLAGASGSKPVPERLAAASAGPTNGLWSDADWISCRDGKWRPVEPGTFPLAHGAASRVVRLRAYGNAINAEAAKTFILAAREAIE